VSRAKGNEAEVLTCKELQKEGYEIITCNFYTRFGEIDIIAQKAGVYHFIEVKSGLDFERAVQNLTPKKMQRILKSVEVYLKQHSSIGDYQIDAAIVYEGRYELIESITL
jgi:putative endonuclease